MNVPLQFLNVFWTSAIMQWNVSVTVKCNFSCVSDLLLFLRKVHFNICHLPEQIKLTEIEGWKAKMVYSTSINSKH